MSHSLRHILSASVSVCVFVFVYVFVSVFVSCKEHQLTTDPSARLVFSSDTIAFDTIFTAAGTSTRSLTIVNPNPNAIRINRIWWHEGKNFFANIDGENNPQYWNNLTLSGGDSLYLFVRAQIDPYGSAPHHPIEHDTLFFEVNGHRQHIAVQAIGLDVQRIRSNQRRSIYPNGLRFRGDSSYLIYDTLIVSDSLILEAGTTLYMHQSASIIAYGPVRAIGSSEHPIRVLGDRTDYLFPQVPYRMASGQWGGIYLLRNDSLPASIYNYRFQHIHLLSGQVGLFCARNQAYNDTLFLHNARIHNMSAYGLVLENTHARLSNAEISNCASYGIYLCGGQHIIEHTSVANFFGYPYTTLNIHNTTRQQVAAVYIQATAADMAPSISSFYNSIITGAVQPAFVIDSIPQTGYPGCIAGCCLRCDSDSLIHQPWAHNNTFAREDDSIFVNTFYKYGEYHYYDFHLSEHSIARHIGLPIDSLQLNIQYDLSGNPRDPEHPDAGCYSYQQ